MMDNEHVVAGADARDFEEGGSGTGIGAWCSAWGTDGAGDKRGIWTSQQDECNGSPPMSSPCVEPTIMHPLPAQPEMILTAWHLQTLARALGLPTTEPINQLRQCIEAVMQKDHGYHNVVTVRESS